MRVAAELVPTRWPGRRWRHSAGCWRSRRGCYARCGSTWRRAPTASRADGRARHAMIEFYTQIRHVPILTVVLNGSPLLLRGILAVAGPRQTHFTHVAPLPTASLTTPLVQLPM